ncbi:MAG TPA: tetratricopeptide repeat protein [Polyangia bacterium]|jgi:tetratricopeptide (TPR) repeat protein|nr:tetratricopeptide repeat protein [Polyangia bacterium]
MGPLDALEVAERPASPTMPAPASHVAPEPAPPFSLVHTHHGVELRLTAWPLGGIARVENLVVAYPEPAADLDSPARLRNRRGRLVEVTLVTDLDQLAHELARPGVRARLAAAGLADLRVGLAEGSFRLVGRATAGDRQAAFTARARLDRVQGSTAQGATVESKADGKAVGATRLRVSIEDLRIYGFVPVAAPQLARAILHSLLPGKPRGRGSIDFDPLDAGLLETFAAHGWRLPDARGTRAQPIQLSARRIALAWEGTAAAASFVDPGTVAPFPPALTEEIEEGDGLLARGDPRGALDAYRRALRRAPDGPASTRVLEVLIASADHVAEADQLAAHILTRQAEAPLALLVRAVAAAERGDPALAADAYEQIATIARRRNEDEDVIIARLAAAEQWLRADKVERARRLAEQVLATMPAHAAGETARLLQILGERLIVAGNLNEADQVFESRLALATDGASRVALIVERARARLLGRDGVVGALAVLGGLPLDQAPREALDLRAELGERAGRVDDAVPALDELAARARREGDEHSARRYEERATRMVERARDGRDAADDRDEAAVSPSLAEGEQSSAATPPAAPLLPADGPQASADELEQLLLGNPTDGTAAESLATIYARISEPSARAEALSGLLRRAPGLSAERRKAIYASLGQSAEASGDLDRAAQAYWRAASIESEPVLRAGFLVSHARVLLARGENETAIGELEEALSRAPDHAGALALRGDLAFRAQDWPRARAIYAALSLSSAAPEVISRELLLYRRAHIAQAWGADGEPEAETYLRELAILNPRHVEARETMADICLRRGDFGGAALRLEEVLRLLPLDALDRLLDVRQRLGGVYLQLQDWTSARYYLELVLAQDPARPVPLKILIDVYLRLGAHREAADACARLARLHSDPSQRAAILYRQGEILRSFLQDDAGALDAFLRASDLDPHFTPALVRLADFYWRQGAFEDLADMASELGGAGFAPDDGNREVPLRLAIATRLAPQIHLHAGGRPAPVPRADEPAGDVVLRARMLAEASSFLAGRAPSDLDPVLDALADEGRAADDGGRGPAGGFYRALEDLVQEDPASANLGAVRALGRAAERGGWVGAARGLYSVLVFVDPDDAAAAALAKLGRARTLDPQEAELEGTLALLAQKQPLEALEAILLEGPLDTGGDRSDPARRRELLRTLRARELVATMLSLDYQRLVS